MGRWALLFDASEVSGPEPPSSHGPAEVIVALPESDRWIRRCLRFKLWTKLNERRLVTLIDLSVSYSRSSGFKEDDIIMAGLPKLEHSVWLKQHMFRKPTGQQALHCF